MKKNIIITIANHKGGVGKTTTAVTLGAGLAALGYPTVLIDCDPQGNVASFLGQPPQPGLFDLLVHRTKATDLVQRIGESKLFIIPGDASTVDVETLLRTSSRFSPATALRDALGSFISNGKPTVVIIDTAPSLSSIQIAALSAADWLLIPASPEFASETGIGALATAIADLQKSGAGVKLLGVLPTLVDPRSIEHKRTVARLHEAFPGLVLPQVRRLISLAEAPRRGKTIWDYDEDAARDYASVLAEVKKRIGL